MEPEPGPGAPRVFPDSGALIGAIEERADEERRRLTAEAEARAAEICAAADAECERMQADGLARLERELVAEQRRLLGEARMLARAEGLSSRRALLAESFQRAEKEIQRRKTGTGAAEALAALAEEARAAVGEPCTLEVSANDGRVTATSADGRRTVENGLDGRLRRAQVAAEAAVARRLFGGSSGGA
jgi:vacuolar-type H+-ATPase subunit E/Vma4